MESTHDGDGNPGMETTSGGGQRKGPTTSATIIGSTRSDYPYLLSEFVTINNAMQLRSACVSVGIRKLPKGNGATAKLKYVLARRLALQMIARTFPDPPNKDDIYTERLVSTDQFFEWIAGALDRIDEQETWEFDEPLVTSLIPESMAMVNVSDEYKENPFEMDIKIGISPVAASSHPVSNTPLVLMREGRTTSVPELVSVSDGAPQPQCRTRGASLEPDLVSVSTAPVDGIECRQCPDYMMHHQRSGSPDSSPDHMRRRQRSECQGSSQDSRFKSEFKIQESHVSMGLEERPWSSHVVRTFVAISELNRLFPKGTRIRRLINAAWNVKGADQVGVVQLQEWMMRWIRGLPQVVHGTSVNWQQYFQEMGIPSNASIGFPTTRFPMNAQPALSSRQDCGVQKVIKMTDDIFRKPDVINVDAQTELMELDLGSARASLGQSHGSPQQPVEPSDSNMEIDIGTSVQQEEQLEAGASVGMEQGQRTRQRRMDVFDDDSNCELKTINTPMIPSTWKQGQERDKRYVQQYGEIVNVPRLVLSTGITWQVTPYPLVPGSHTPESIRMADELYSVMQYYYHTAVYFLRRIMRTPLRFHLPYHQYVFAELILGLNLAIDTSEYFAGNRFHPQLSLSFYISMVMHFTRLWSSAMLPRGSLGRRLMQSPVWSIMDDRSSALGMVAELVSSPPPLVQPPHWHEVNHQLGRYNLHFRLDTVMQHLGRYHMNRDRDIVASYFYTSQELEHTQRFPLMKDWPTHIGPPLVFGTDNFRTAVSGQWGAPIPMPYSSFFTDAVNSAYNETSAPGMPVYQTTELAVAAAREVLSRLEDE